MDQLYASSFNAQCKLTLNRTSLIIVRIFQRKKIYYENRRYVSFCVSVSDVRKACYSMNSLVRENIDN